MSGTLASASRATPDAAYREEWRRLEGDPGPLVFLLGCQRSGTTWLHLQLARTGTFRFLSAYDVDAIDTLVHNEREGIAGAARQAFDAALDREPAHRGIDAIPARADTPEEYGLVIGGGSLRYDEPDTTAATLPRLRELCAKKALLEGRDRPLLLKSPPDYPRAIPDLAAAWPRARFVAIERHPLRTLDSQVRAWRELIAHRNAYLTLLDRGYRALFEDEGRRMKLGIFLHSQAGVEWLADAVLRAHLGFLAVCESWPDRDRALLVVRYEDLCADQRGTFRQLSAFLQIALPDPPRRPSPRDRAVSVEVQRAFDARRDAFGPFLARFGYGAEPE